MKKTYVKSAMEVFRSAKASKADAAAERKSEQNS